MTYSVVEYEANEFIFKQGDPGDLMYLVQDGEVEVLQDLGGSENQVAVLERGDFFGEMAVLEEEVRSHSVRALVASRLIKIDRSGFQNMLMRNADGELWIDDEAPEGDVSRRVDDRIREARVDQAGRCAGNGLAVEGHHLERSRGARRRCQEDRPGDRGRGDARERPHCVPAGPGHADSFRSCGMGSSAS